MKITLQSISALILLAGAAQAEESQRLQVMAADPTHAEAQFTGGPAYEAVPVPVGGEAMEVPKLTRPQLRPLDAPSPERAAADPGSGGQLQVRNVFRTTWSIIKTSFAYGTKGAVIGGILGAACGLFAVKGVAASALLAASALGAVGLIFGVVYAMAVTSGA
jgi:hypothetical protein